MRGEEKGGGKVKLEEWMKKLINYIGKQGKGWEKSERVDTGRGVGGEQMVHCETWSG